MNERVQEGCGRRASGRAGERIVADGREEDKVVLRKEGRGIDSSIRDQSDSEVRKKKKNLN